MPNRRSFPLPIPHPRQLAARAALALALPLAGLATDAGAQEYLVLREQSNFTVAPADNPHVVVPFRADNFVRTAVVTCDTRDAARRIEELEATMEAILAAAAESDQIEISVVREANGESFVVAVEDMETFRRFIRTGSRPDTSAVTFILKTPVGDGDDLASVTARLDAFIPSVALTGRTELFFSGRPELTLIDPRQYRMDVIRAIAADAQEIMTALGDGYAVEIYGLERELGWRRSGDLELSLFIPHEIEIVPRP